MLRKIAIICLIYMVLLATLSVTINPASAATNTEVKVINPETGDGNFLFYSNMTAVGTRFNVTVWLYNVTNLYAHQVKMIVNDTLLNITNAWIPKWNSTYVFYGLSTMPLGPTFYDQDADGVYESVLIGDTIMGPGSSFTGTGLLAIIELEIIYTPETGEETSELNIDNPDTFLLDSDLNDIPAMKTNGVYKIIGAPAPPISPSLLYIDPARIVDPTLTPGSSFSVDVKIINATDVYALGFKLGYDPAVISIDNITFGEFFPAESYTTTIDNVAGLLTVSAQLSPPEPPRSGNGTLITVYFYVEGVGATPIDLFDTAVLDEGGSALPHISEDGFFNNIFLAKLYVDPEQLISPKLMPSYIFSVNITIDDVENLYGYQFKLDYNTKMLTCIGIYVYPIHNQSAFTTTMQVEDTDGWLWINVTFHEPATPITTYTPEPLVKITFIVENVGLSVLDLQATSLVNSTGRHVPHEAYDGYVQTEIHDVAITNVTVEPDWVYEGWIVNVTITVKNLGNVSETFDVNVYYDSNLIAVETVENLQPGCQKTIKIAWNTTGVEEGIYTIKAEATPVPYEFNLENNVYVDGTVEVRRLIRDIAIRSLTAYPTAVYPGWPVNLSVTVRNEGNLTETFTITLYYNSNVITTFEVVDLAPNKELTLNYVWNTTRLPECSNYTISAEAEPLPYEVDLEDNHLVDGYVKIKICGDINGDDKVDIRDVATVASAFGSYPGHPRWNPESDLNQDGKVDIRDVAIVAANFGRIC